MSDDIEIYERVAALEAKREEDVLAREELKTMIAKVGATVDSMAAKFNQATGGANMLVRMIALLASIGAAIVALKTLIKG
ncbi:MAG: hypothetical protein P4L82_16685 [Ancalomicrobiaceae bacterium]|nr:hypothetical protein [Ancalomicrobiaceae bacterium]